MIWDLIKTQLWQEAGVLREHLNKVDIIAQSTLDWSL